MYLRNIFWHSSFSFCFLSLHNRDKCQVIPYKGAEGDSQCDHFLVVSVYVCVNWESSRLWSAYHLLFFIVLMFDKLNCGGTIGKYLCKYFQDLQFHPSLGLIGTGGLEERSHKITGSLCTTSWNDTFLTFSELFSVVGENWQISIIGGEVWWYSWYLRSGIIYQQRSRFWPFISLTLSTGIWLHKIRKFYSQKKVKQQFPWSRGVCQVKSLTWWLQGQR